MMTEWKVVVRAIEVLGSQGYEASLMSRTYPSSKQAQYQGDSGDALEVSDEATLAWAVLNLT